MLGLLKEMITSLKKLEKFSLHILGFGVRLSIGLLMLSAFLYSLLGHFGDFMTAFVCARGALDAAPAVFVCCLAMALISDLLIKERASNG